MKVIIFGVNGMAGHMTALYLAERGHQITGFARHPKGFGEGVSCIEGDALNQDAVRRVLAEGKYDAVINCIGILNRAVDAKLSEGIYLNSVFPHFLAECAEETGARVIHISTDCVFSGRKGRYTEGSVPDAESYYGRSKALGELIDDRNLTLRTSIVGPELKEDGIGLFHWFMGQDEEADGFTRAIWSGVTTLELAKAIEAALYQNLTGLYHLVNNEEISKYELLRLFNEYSNQNRTVIHEKDTFVNNKSLLDTRQELKHVVPSYRDMVQEQAEWIESHRDLYSCYLKK
ncbi:SDR family oxidoreductase [Lachnospiraceae bacterium 46-15]